MSTRQNVAPETATYLVTAIANGCMTLVATSFAHGLALCTQLHVTAYWHESVCWVMTVLVFFVARDANVEVVAIFAGDETRLRVNYE